MVIRLFSRPAFTSVPSFSRGFFSDFTRCPLLHIGLCLSNSYLGLFFLCPEGEDIINGLILVTVTKIGCNQPGLAIGNYRVCLIALLFAPLPSVNGGAQLAPCPLIYFQRGDSCCDSKSLQLVKGYVGLMSSVLVGRCFASGSSSDCSMSSKTAL